MVIIMPWEKVSEELSEFLEKALTRFKCQKKKMFGCPVYFINNNIFAGVHQDTIFIRLSEKDREKLFSSYDEATPFEPIEGRIMKEYVVLPESLFEDRETFEKWLNLSFKYVSSLPPKKPKTRKKKSKKKS